MAEIDPGVLILYSAIIICIGNALACHFGAWQVWDSNLKFEIGAVVGNLITFASIFAVGIACISYNQYPTFGFFLVFLSPVMGSMSIWLTMMEPTYEPYHRVKTTVIGLLRGGETVDEEIEWAKEVNKEVEEMEMKVEAKHSAPMQVDCYDSDDTVHGSAGEWEAVSPGLELDDKFPKEPPKEPKKTVRWAIDE